VSTAARGSAGNVLAALASLFIPGLGQLLQGRPFKALFHVVLSGVLWLVTFGLLGWVMHVWSALEAARWDPMD
jgi:TM2 domain-containing membrane protein YozV